MTDKTLNVGMQVGEMKIEPLIVAALSLFASVVTASLSYRLTKRHQINLEGRRLKEEYYRAFIKALSDVAIDNKDVAAQKRLSEGFNSLIVIGSPSVVKKLMEFHGFARIENLEIPRDSNEWLCYMMSYLERSLKKCVEIFTEMKKYR